MNNYHESVQHNYATLPRNEQLVLLDSMTEQMYDIQDMLEAARIGRAMLMNIIKRGESHE